MIGDKLEKGVNAGSAHESSDVEWPVSVWVMCIVEGVGDGGSHGSAHKELCWIPPEGFSVKVLLRWIEDGVGDGGTHGSAQRLCLPIVVVSALPIVSYAVVVVVVVVEDLDTL